MLLLLWGRLPKMVPVDALNPVGILIPDNGRLDSHKRLYTMAVQMFISSWIGHVPFWQWKVKATNFYRGHEVKRKFHVINNTQFIRKMELVFAQDSIWTLRCFKQRNDVQGWGQLNVNLLYINHYKGVVTRP